MEMKALADAGTPHWKDALAEHVTQLAADQQ